MSGRKRSDCLGKNETRASRNKPPRLTQCAKLGKDNICVTGNINGARGTKLAIEVNRRCAQCPQAAPAELCVSGDAVNVEIPATEKSRERSGELGQRAPFYLRIVRASTGRSREVKRALLAKTSQFLASNCECAARRTP